MSGLKDFAEGLQQEVVSEIAENYFGMRKSLDEMIEALDVWADDLRKQAELVRHAASHLHCMLVDESYCQAFYAAIGAVPIGVSMSCHALVTGSISRLPFSFTNAGQYAKCVFAAYEVLAERVDNYLNGRYYVDSEDPHGRKRLTVHYVRFQAMFDFVNQQIEQVNRRTTSCDTLRYVKHMDPELLEKEKVLDASLSDYCSLAEKMRYEILAMEDYRVDVFRALPASDGLRSEIFRFAKQLYRKERGAVVALLKELKAAIR